MAKSIFATLEWLFVCWLFFNNNKNPELQKIEMDRQAI